VATLIAKAGHDDALAAALSQCAAALPGSGRAWLAAGHACDLAFAGDPGELPAIRARLHAALEPLPVDVIVQPVEGRRKRLLVADMDSTMIGQECIDELADVLGLKAKVAAITERAMRGEIAFAPALRERVALLAGLPVDTIGTVIEERITLTPGGPELIRTMRANSGLTVLVSGGFTAFADVIGARIGFDRVHANVLLHDDGKLSGKVAEPILGREAKLATLTAAAAERGIPLAAAIAVGDGANDLDMIRAAGLGVAFHAKPLVAEAAAARIDHGDLTALLYAQGYRQSDFVR
jgi:phosphoserine phosphatase